MTYKEKVMALAKAGFNADEIRNLVEAPAEPKTTEPKTAEATPEWANALMKAVEGLSKSIKADAVQHSEQPPEQSLEEMLASIL